MAELAERLESVCHFKESKTIETVKSTIIDGQATLRMDLNINEDIIECDLVNRSRLLLEPESTEPELPVKSNGQINFEFDIWKTVFERQEVNDQVQTKNPMFINGHWARDGAMSNVLIQLHAIFPKW